MTTNNIPKIIHYCWFGNSPKTKLVKNVLLVGKNIYLNMK